MGAVPAMSSLLRIRPTKIELIRLRRRLALAKKVHRILRERLTILVNEFLLRVREAFTIRRKIGTNIMEVYNKSFLLYSVYGENIINYYSTGTKKKLKAIVGLENIMGVKTVTVRIEEPEYIETTVIKDLDDFRKECIGIIKDIIELGKAEKAINALGREILKTKRKVNALEYTLIPQIRNTIKYLRMKFEEREREEKARLKRVKALLERRRGK